MWGAIGMGNEGAGQYEGDGYRRALELAWDRLLSRDLGEAARNAMARLEGDHLVLPFLGRETIVDVRSRSVTVSGKNAPVAESILVLHYLDGARAARPSGEWVSFRQLRGGHAYYGAFKRRTIDGIASLFHHRPGTLLTAAKRLGGTGLSIGDASARLEVFPKVPVAVAVWAGDDEIGGSANLLFDETASAHLPVEDLAEAGSLVLDLLSDAARSSS